MGSSSPSAAAKVRLRPNALIVLKRRASSAKRDLLVARLRFVGLRLGLVATIVGSGSSSVGRIEGKREFKDYEPLAAGFATADRQSFVREVDDGLLEIDFDYVIENPTISAVEVERLD